VHAVQYNAATLGINRSPDRDKLLRPLVLGGYRAEMMTKSCAHQNCALHKKAPLQWLDFASAAALAYGLSAFECIGSHLQSIYRRYVNS
jgi:hypothetical protein